MSSKQSTCVSERNMQINNSDRFCRFFNDVGQLPRTTLNIVLSVTYYLELRSVITTDFKLIFCQQKVKLVLWTL